MQNTERESVAQRMEMKYECRCSGRRDDHHFNIVARTRFWTSALYVRPVFRYHYHLTPLYKLVYYNILNAPSAETTSYACGRYVLCSSGHRGQV